MAGQTDLIPEIYTIFTAVNVTMLSLRYCFCKFVGYIDSRMWKSFAFALFILFVVPELQAQEYLWRLGFDYFFDNREFKKSAFIDSQTQNGIWLKPQGGISWDSTHTIYAGVNLLKIPGGGEAVDKVDMTLYYQYETDRVLFRAGSFPRKEVLRNYSSFFFKDSVNNFVPLMQGVFWQIGKERNFFNAWMDWTGYASPTARESFFLGFSGRLSSAHLFGDFQSYMFHYAGTFPVNSAYGVSEQLQGLASLGIEYDGDNSFKGLLTAGVFAGMERDRKAVISYFPVGFTARADAEFWGIGTRNTLYAGDRRMRFYSQHGDNLYWGTQFLRGSTYIESMWYVRLLNSDRVTAQFNLNLHFSGGEMLFQQAFSVSASIDNIINPVKKKVSYPWMRIFQ